MPFGICAQLFLEQVIQLNDSIRACVAHCPKAILEYKSPTISCMRQHLSLQCDAMPHQCLLVPRGLLQLHMACMAKDLKLQQV